MVIVQGTFRINPSDRDAFLAQSIEQMEISRAEQGCLQYVLAADPLEADRVILSERWETSADLGAHAQALTERRAAAASAGESSGVQPTSREITVFEVASSQPLG
jgi:quinol monooxygenase YgiN